MTSDHRMFTRIAAASVILVFCLGTVDAYFVRADIREALAVALFPTLCPLVAFSIAMLLSPSTGRGPLLRACAYFIFSLVTAVYVVYALSSVAHPNPRATNHLAFLPMLLLTLTAAVMGLGAAVAYIWKVEATSRQ
jgi:hypothetical protein